MDLATIATAAADLAAPLVVAVAGYLGARLLNWLDARHVLNLSEQDREVAANVISDGAGLLNLALHRGALTLGDVQVGNPAFDRIAQTVLGQAADAFRRRGITATQIGTKLASDLGDKLRTPGVSVKLDGPIVEPELAKPVPPPPASASMDDVLAAVKRVVADARPKPIDHAGDVASLTGIPMNIAGTAP